MKIGTCDVLKEGTVCRECVKVVLIQTCGQCKIGIIYARKYDDSQMGVFEVMTVFVTLGFLCHLEVQKVLLLLLVKFVHF